MQEHKNKSNKWQIIEAIIIDIIVASIIVIAIIITTKILFGKQIKKAIEVVDMVSINSENSIIPEIKFYEKNNTMIKYPEYGSRYGNIKIDSLNINLPLYYGDKLSILKNGIGHSSGSYFPGEGGSIIYMGHNSKNMFRRFSELQKGNEIKVTTSYGEYVYKIYDMQLIKETELDKLPIQRDKEILMVYTCYPFNNVGYATQRYVVYAELEK